MKSFTKIFIVAGSMLAMTAGAQGQSLQQAIGSVDRDLEVALKELADLRTKISSERAPLSKELDELENEVISKNAELQRRQGLRDNRELGIRALEQEVNSKQQEIDYVAGLLRDFVRSFSAQLHVSEKQIFANRIADALGAVDDSNLNQQQLFDVQMKIVGASVDRLNDLFGGYSFSGRAIASTGEVVTGKFALLGPSVYFRSDDQKHVGIAVAQLSSGEVNDATIVTSEVFEKQKIAALIDTGEGSLPLDASLGAAIEVERHKDTFVTHINKGGVVGYMTLSLAMAALLIAIYKVVQVTSFRVPTGDFVLDLAEDVKRGDTESALQKARGFPGIAGAMFEEAVENSSQPRSLIEEYLSVKIIIARRKLESLLPFIAITAAAAPLMGLLGTVVGMIKTFKLITIFGTGDARQLSDGISEALVTTEIGLYVAIPSLIIHGILSRMARGKWGQLEQDAIVFLNDVKED